VIAPKPIYFVNLALALLLAWACWSAFAPVPPARIPAKKAGETPLPEPDRIANAPRLARAHYNVIEQANIFKNKDVIIRPPEPTPVTPTPVPLPPLDLQLQGTTIGRRDQIVKAIIFNKKTRKTETYVKNDVIPETGGAKITEITRNKVVIDRQGQSDSLESYPPDVKQLHESTGTKTLTR
jgi:type II secretory pathway component PulC